jgi:uncharacterized protein YacL
LLYLERRIPQMSLNVVLGGWVGIMCGALVAFLINKAIAASTTAYRHHIEFVYVATLLFMGYLGLRIGAHFGQWLDSNTIKALFGDKTPNTINKILDTSVIIGASSKGTSSFPSSSCASSSTSPTRPTPSSAPAAARGWTCSSG